METCAFAAFAVGSDTMYYTPSLKSGRPLVSTLPIRNGNKSMLPAFTLTFATCKYLTYKEWKLCSESL